MKRSIGYFMQAQFFPKHAVQDAPVNMHLQSYVQGQNCIIVYCRDRTRHSTRQCAASTRSTHFTLLFVVMLLFMLPIRSFCTSSGFIDVGFTGSAMAYVDTNGDFLFSSSSIFSLSFFSSMDQALFYLCVIHTASQEIVWTANRDAPLSQSDQLVFSVDGNMALVHGNGSSTLWSSNTTGLGVKQMHMLDSGNLILVDGANETVWQSFDHPTNTLLNGQVLRPGMHLTSSVSQSNMSSGLFSLSLGTSDLRLVFSPSTQVYWSMLQDVRLISWDRSGIPSYVLLNSTGLSLVRNDGVVLSSISWISNAALCKASLQPDGNLMIYVYSSNVWITQFTALQSGCSLPLFCGALGVCKFGQCSCPNLLQPLNENNIAQGCHGLANPSCINSSSDPGSHFEEIGDGLEYFANGYMSPTMVSGLEGCKNLCMQNCSCSSFFFYKESGSCFLFTQLGTIQSSGKAGHVLYIKTNQVINSPNMDLNASGIASPQSQGLPSFVLPVVLGGTSLLVLVLACAFMYWFCKMHKAHFLNQEGTEVEDELFLGTISGLPTRFTFKELQIATKNFSKKLGEGGFGSVYEGTLPADKTRIAVKRLEGVGMGQGTKEFRAEVAIIGRIHHVHLVQLCGFCTEGSHRLLVYEFLANGSLDKCLFGEGKKILDWNTRYQIALGTARGLAYLHDDCREKIIHCDIKPENILLDENYNAKVSDFGMAKLVNKEQSQVFTTMRGTRGYLAPEWLMNLPISEKSDVYSFGLVLLEIISGRKNLELTEVSEKRYFPLYAFEQAEKDRMVKLVDEKLKENICGDEVIRAVKVALWCIQEEISARPSMAKVVQMLEGNVKILNPPLSTQFSSRGHANMMEAMEWSERSSSSSNFRKSQGYQSAVQLSEAR